MNRLSIIAAFFALVFLAGQNALAQSGYDLFQKGLVQERTEGDLNEAIRLYKQIVEDFTDDHALAAKALLQIGGCYEKLGRAEAQKAYQRVIEEYPGQKQEVAVAKERIAELSKALEEVAHKPTFRKISIPTKISWDAQLSPDGKKVILASNGKLWIMPLSGKLGSEFPGTPVKLNTGNVGVSRFGLAWSADGRWIAFNENYETPEKLKDIKGTSGIYVVPAQGDKPKKVYENYRGGLFLNYGISLEI